MQEQQVCLGQEVEATIHGLTHDGRGVGRLDTGLVVFVPGALPEQRIILRLEEVKKKQATGNLVRVLSQAPNLRTAPCVHAQDCGGCPWQEMPYALQCQWKQRLVEDCLKRLGNLSVAALPILPAPAEWGYRNKMEFTFAAPEGDKLERGAQPWIVGLYRRFSHKVEEVQHCLLQADMTMQVLETVRDFLSSHIGTWQEALRFLVVRTPHKGGLWVEIITWPIVGQEISKNVGELFQSLQALGIDNLTHSSRKAPSAVAYGERVVQSWGQGELCEDLLLPNTFAGSGQGTLFLRFGVQSFFQVNTLAAQALYQLAAQEVREQARLRGDKLKSVWDVYAGVGGFALAAAPFALEVRAFESVPQAVSWGRKNAAGQSHVHFEVADAAKLGTLFKKYGVPDMIIADPPRSGLDPETLAALLQHRPGTVLIVSCNPATLARDLGQLSAAYQIVKVQPVDLFPQTPHVESIALLKLR